MSKPDDEYDRMEYVSEVYRHWGDDLSDETEPEVAYHSLTRTNRDILTVVADADQPHGLQVAELVGNLQDGSITSGAIYPSLADLTERGLLIRSEPDARTTEYELSDAGQRTLEVGIAMILP